MNRYSLGRAAVCVALVMSAACSDHTPPTASTAPRTTEPNLGLDAARGAPGGSLPNGKGIGTRTYSPAPRTKNRVEYHNGAVLLGTVRVYFIFYGNWTGEVGGAEQILTDFVLTLSGSRYMKIHTLYPDVTGAAPNAAVSWGRNVVDLYSRGATLTDGDVQTIMRTTILQGTLPLDPNGVYFVVGAPDVDVTSGLGVTYCAFHNTAMVAGVPIAYGFIGNPERNPSACAPQLFGPSGNFAADAMVNLVAAELSNAITNTQLTGWYDRSGLSPADKCAWDFGPTYQAPNGALANLHYGGRDYLVQRLWVPSGKGGTAGSCALTAPNL